MKRKITILFFSLFYATGIFGQEKYVSSSTEASFEGIDLVSYHQYEAPRKGSEEYSIIYDGLTLFFENKENKEAFNKDPEAYLPAYGGYCATACSNGNFVIPDYNNFSIENGQLYLFEVRGFWNGKTAWKKNPEKNKLKADQNYEKILIEHELEK